MKSNERNCVGTDQENDNNEWTKNCYLVNCIKIHFIAILSSHVSASLSIFSIFGELRTWNEYLDPSNTIVLGISLENVHSVYYKIVKLICPLLKRFKVLRIL